MTQLPAASGSTSYLTTRPIFPLSPARHRITVPIKASLTIQLRRFELTDLPHIYRLRTQHEVMIHTAKGCIDEDMAASQEYMDRYLPPNDAATLDLAVWAKATPGAATDTDNGGEGRDEGWEHIGILGCHISSPLPHIGYMIRTEWWGKGIATATLKAFLAYWWRLPRQVTRMDLSKAKDEHERHLIGIEMSQPSAEVDVETGLKKVPEVLLAEIEEQNLGSKRVIEKCGFQYVGKEDIVHERLGQFVLLDYIACKPEGS